ncbi:MAG: flagellar protein FlaG [Lachnospiraceae bacterium]|nr:flagellar protein FlaG [Lachnospiraceae bacterium]
MEVIRMYVEPMGQMRAFKPVTKVEVVKPEMEKVSYAESKEGIAEYHAKESSTSQEMGEKNPYKEPSAADNDRIKKALKEMNAQLPNSEAKFGIHEETNRVMIKLVDKDTQEVIKEFPPEKTLDMIAKCMELAGVLVDEKL